MVGSQFKMDNYPRNDMLDIHINYQILIYQNQLHLYKFNNYYYLNMLSILSLYMASNHHMLDNHHSNAKQHKYNFRIIFFMKKLYLYKNHKYCHHYKLNILNLHMADNLHNLDNYPNNVKLHKYIFTLLFSMRKLCQCKNHIQQHQNKLNILNLRMVSNHLNKESYPKNDLQDISKDFQIFMMKMFQCNFHKYHH